MRCARDHNDISESVTENTPFFPSGQNQAAAGQRVHLTKSILYGVQNFYAFMLMYVPALFACHLVWSFCGLI
jgi:hypothetical protein